MMSGNPYVGYTPPPDPELLLLRATVLKLRGERKVMHEMLTAAGIRDDVLNDGVKTCLIGRLGVALGTPRPTKTDWVFVRRQLNALTPGPVFVPPRDLRPTYEDFIVRWRAPFDCVRPACESCSTLGCAHHRPARQFTASSGDAPPPPAPRDRA